MLLHSTQHTNKEGYMYFGYNRMRPEELAQRQAEHAVYLWHRRLKKNYDKQRELRIQRKQRLLRHIKLHRWILVARNGGFGFIMGLIALLWLYIAWTDAWLFADRSGAITMAMLFASPFLFKRIRKHTLIFLYTLFST